MSLVFQNVYNTTGSVNISVYGDWSNVLIVPQSGSAVANYTVSLPVAGNGNITLNLMAMLISLLPGLYYISINVGTPQVVLIPISWIEVS